MHVKAKLSSYEKVAFSVTLTAPVEDWRAMLKKLEQLKGSCGYYEWPVSGLVECINSMLCNLDKTHADTRGKDDT